MPPEVHRSICVLGRKLAKAIYYLDSARIFPAEGTLLMRWFSNEQLLERGYYPVIEAMKSLAGDTQLLERNGKYLNSQFEYKLSISTEKNIFILQSLFGKSFGFVVFGSTRPGFLETEMQALAERNKSPSPFTILQSPKLVAFDHPG
ncbi:MAG: hypothetical protein ABW154_12600 [Dyella sp.]